MVRTIFRDKGTQELFDRNGYVVIDAFTDSEINEFERAYDLIEGKENTAFESTMNNQNLYHKKQVHELVLSYFKPLIGEQLDNYVPVTGNFVTKRSGKNGEVCPHQDWSVTDEEYFRGVNIWVPFVDTNEENGAIYIVKGSHLLPPGKRGSYVPTYFNQNIFSHYHDFTPVFMRKGQALIYDLRCIHASPPNVSGQTRIAAGCACAPGEAQLVHHYYDSQKNALKTYHVTPEFFTQYSYLHGEIPDSFLPSLIQSDFCPERYDAVIQADILKRQRINGISFINNNLQKQYEEDGYVVVDCFTDKQVSEISAFYHENSKWFTDGFFSSVYAPDFDYRVKVDEFLEPYAHELVNTFFNDYQVIISSFMVKGLGDKSEMYPHQDWSNVDETLYSSFNIWIPLVDVSHKNGSLYLLKGSHLLPFTFRGSNVPDALTDYSAFTSDSLTYIPLKAGQALIYDHRCIHYSPVNKSNRVRPACSINVAPKKAPLIHYFYEKENSGSLLCFKADKHFYFKHVVSQNKIPEYGNLKFKYNPGRFIKFDPNEVNQILKRQKVRKSFHHLISSWFNKKRSNPVPNYFI
jgi:ectoine hydroxylase-related dioxygenase (phytanoyl-CoA dioxygenase family)